MSRAAADLCGTPSGYKRGCRCDDCRRANTRQVAAQKRDRLIRSAADPSLIPHGTPSGYINWCCRCDDCREANRQARIKDDRPSNGHRPWTDAERAVAMQDRPLRDIAAELGRSYNAVLTMRYQQRYRSTLTADKEAS